MRSFYRAYPELLQKGHALRDLLAPAAGTGVRNDKGHAVRDDVPDLVAETNPAILMIETKARDELKSPEALAKAEAAAQWCAHASSFSQSIDGKPWTYLLVPHDLVSEAARLIDLLRFKRSV